MAPYVSQLGDKGIDYRPITFSCYGRPHEHSMTFIREIAKRKSRRRGTERHIEERRIMNKVTQEIWRRGARMVRRCMEVSANLIEDEEEGGMDDAIRWRRQDDPRGGSIRALLGGS